MEAMPKLLGLSDDAHSLSTQGRMPKTRSRLAPSNTFKGKKRAGIGGISGWGHEIDRSPLYRGHSTFQFGWQFNVLKSDHLFMTSAWFFTLHCIKESVLHTTLYSAKCLN